MLALSTDEQTILETQFPRQFRDALLQASVTDDVLATACYHLENELHRLVPFVPTPIVALRLKDPTATRINSRCLSGTIICADLSGFTALSGRLATMGRSGSEEISVLINRLFSTLLDQIFHYGGGLIQFGGDALTAFFDEEQLGQEHALLACAAAVAMQERMHDFAQTSTSQGVFALRLRIMVHSGKMFISELGDAHHTTLFATGTTLHEVTIGQEAAAPGEVLISRTTLRWLEDVQVTPKEPGLYLLSALERFPSSKPRSSALIPYEVPSRATLKRLLQRLGIAQTYVPSEIVRRFGSESEAVTIGEFRPVTVLFADFYDFRRLSTLLDPCEVGERPSSMVGTLIATWYDRMHRIIQHYGGSVNKVDMASYGNRLMALFGAPIAHEDDPVRAVQAAYELQAELVRAEEEIAPCLAAWEASDPMRRSLPRLPTVASQQRTGIALGPVFAGLVGGSQRHEYTVMGQTVNLAARLLSAANKGDVLLSPAAYRTVHHLIDAEALPPLTPKGFSQALSVMRLVGLRGEQPEPLSQFPPTAAPVVGREEELARLHDIAHHALTPGSEAGYVVALIGEPGVGKSRLTSELLHDIRAESSAVRIVRETCQGYEQTLSYAVFSRLLRRLLHLPLSNEHPRDAAAVERQIAELVPCWSRFASLLSPLLHVPMEETPLIQALSAEERHARLHDVIIMLCRALAEQQPLLLVIEDVHWADASSHELMGRLADELRGVPLLLILIYRSTMTLDEPWAGLPNSELIWLHELTWNDSLLLLRALLQGEPPPELLPLLQRLHGTPMFLEETVRYLVDSGILQRAADERWECRRPINSITIPNQIEQLIIARLDRLPEEARTLAQVAAVIGDQVDVQVLRIVSASCHVPIHRLGDLVADLFLVPINDMPRATYRFKHILLRDIAYESLLFARRRELHGQVAATIETLYGNDLDEHRVTLAHHYLQAGQREQAFPHFLRAAQQAQARYAHREALALYEQALAIVALLSVGEQHVETTTVLHLHAHMADVLSLLGEYDQAREHFDQALALGAARTDTHEDVLFQVALQRKIGATYESQGDREHSLMWLRQAQTTLIHATTRGVGSLAANMAGLPPGSSITSREPDPAMAATWAVEHARILCDISWIYFRQNSMEEAQEYLEQALAHIDLHHAYDEQARILNQLGGIAWSQGELSLAHYYVEKSLEIAQQSGDLIGQANTLSNLGILSDMQGKPQEAIAYMLHAMEINEQIGRRRDLAVNALNIGWTFYDLADYEQAQRYVLQALEHAQAVRDTYHQMRALLNLGTVLTALQRWDESHETLQQSAMLARDLDLPSEELEAHIALAELGLEQGNLALAEHEYEQGLPLITDRESEEYGRFQRLEAKIALAQNNVSRALQLLQANERLFSQLQDTIELRRTRSLLADVQQALLLPNKSATLPSPVSSLQEEARD